MKELIAVLVLSLGLPVLAHEGGHRAYGVVKEVTVSRLVVTDEHGKDTSFALGAATEYLRDRKRTTRDKIMVGERVVVKGRDASGQMEAVAVSVGADPRHDH
jgi:hypothetical protein